MANKCSVTRKAETPFSEDRYHPTGRPAAPTLPATTDVGRWLNESARAFCTVGLRNRIRHREFAGAERTVQRAHRYVCPRPQSLSLAGLCRYGLRSHEKHEDSKPGKSGAEHGVAVFQPIQSRQFRSARQRAYGWDLWSDHLPRAVPDQHFRFHDASQCRTPHDPAEIPTSVLKVGSTFSCITALVARANPSEIFDHPQIGIELCLVDSKLVSVGRL